MAKHSASNAKPGRAPSSSANKNKNKLFVGIFFLSLVLNIILKAKNLFFLPTTIEESPAEISLKHFQAQNPPHRAQKPPTTESTITNNDPIVVAYAITVTDCSPSQQHHLVDAAAVLKHSIHLASSKSRRYGYQMYAFLHPDARGCHLLAAALGRIGYNVQWRDTPFLLEDVLDHGAKLREKIHKQGCCSEKEFLKLYTLTLAQHPIAIHLDVDTLVLRNWDHLFDVLLSTNDINTPAKQLVNQHRQPHAQQQGASSWASTTPNDLLTFFTRDYNMAYSLDTPPTRILMQGGFWIVRPNGTIFDDIVSMVVEHGDHFNTPCGWGGCDLGSARFYGGAGFQGVISYYYSYYHHLRDQIQITQREPRGPVQHLPPGPHPHLVELNRCLYNSMADQARVGCGKEDPNNLLNGVACDHCNETDFGDLYGAHFTICQKPWLCGGYQDNELCYRFHHAWHGIRDDFVRQQRTPMATSSLSLDVPVVPGSDHAERKGYAQRIVQKFPSQCQSVGSKGYMPMDLL